MGAGRVEDLQKGWALGQVAWGSSGMGLGAVEQGTLLQGGLGEGRQHVKPWQQQQQHLP